jgi:hypothetical protein
LCQEVIPSVLNLLLRCLSQTNVAHSQEDKWTKVGVHTASGIEARFSSADIPPHGMGDNIVLNLLNFNQGISIKHVFSLSGSSEKDSSIIVLITLSPERHISSGFSHGKSGSF